MLHLNEIAALKAAKAHLLEAVHHHEFCVGEDDLRRLGGALQRGDIDHIGVKIRFAELGGSFGRERDIPLALIALLGVVFRQTVTQ